MVFGRSAKSPHYKSLSNVASGHLDDIEIVIGSFLEYGTEVTMKSLIYVAYFLTITMQGM